MNIRPLLIVLAISLTFQPYYANAENSKNIDNATERLQLYRTTEAITGIPWYVIGGIDQYERSIRLADKDLQPILTNISITFSDDFWCGVLNPNKQDVSPETIAYFDGNGIDGDGDGQASRSSDLDILMTISAQLQPYGIDDENIKIGLWNYYHRDKAVSIVMANSNMFKKFGTNELQQKNFPISKWSNYDYKDTFGMARGWGGRRSHEGTDIFADYGTEVSSASYGVVELKGWNKYGGWRLGIRDINNTYYYYAHLGSFAKEIKIGDIVEPGQVIGSVGSSGYGKEGTSGKFPPHLHFGMYKDDGSREWSFNPYPLLVKWERNR